ncbi:MAG: DUF2848 family protein [Desulfobacterales bacterium]|jgi:hypothetical protein
MIFQFIVEEKTGKREIDYEVNGAVLCGYTGRDQEAVRKHIEELAKEGVDPPPSVPTQYPKPAWGLTQKDAIQVEGRETSGEVEFFLLMDENSIFTGLASDHTDRELERLDIRKSKQVCPTILSKNIWNYEDVKEAWDQIQIRSWAIKGGQKNIYQESTLGSILPPEELIRLVQEQLNNDIGGIVIFSGTPPILSGEMIFADRFEAELLDTSLNRKITIEYEIQTLEWFKD